MVVTGARGGVPTERSTARDRRRRAGVALAVGTVALLAAACSTTLGASTPPAPGNRVPSTLLPGRFPPGSVLAPAITLPSRRSSTSLPNGRADQVDPKTGGAGSASGSGRSPDVGATEGARLDGLAGFYAPPLTLSAAPPGSLVRSAVMDTGGSLPPGATAYRVVYDSTSLSGNLEAVSGVIVVPGGVPPRGGFPIVSWAHGTTGVAASCAPSLSGLSGIPSLTALVEARMIVVATDYPGLGVAGPDPYLVGQSEAQSVLDIARAARNLEGQAASNRVLVVGYSQGGQAALFAGQIAPSYAPELYLEGVAAVAPVASITELAPVVPGDRDDPDAGFAAMALRSWSDTYGNIPLGSVLTDQAVRRTAVMATSCSGAVDAAYDGTPTDQLFQAGWSTNPAAARRRRGQPARPCPHQRAVAGGPGHSRQSRPLRLDHPAGDRQPVWPPERRRSLRGRQPAPATKEPWKRASRSSSGGWRHEWPDRSRPTPAHPPPSRPWAESRAWDGCGSAAAALSPSQVAHRQPGAPRAERPRCR